MKRRNVYTVEYRLHGTWDDVKNCHVIASNKEEAYDNAYYEEIPKMEGTLPYSAWVSDVTYQNGNCKYFNAFEGNPF